MRQNRGVINSFAVEPGRSWEIGVRGLERWISTDIAEGVAKGSIMEDAETRADSSLAIFPRIPSKTKARLNIFIVRLIEGMPVPGPRW